GAIPVTPNRELESADLPAEQDLALPWSSSETVVPVDPRREMSLGLAIPYPKRSGTGFEKASKGRSGPALTPPALGPSEPIRRPWVRFHGSPAHSSRGS